MVVTRSQEAALQYKIKSKSTEVNEVNLKMRQVKQKLMWTENKLSYTNLDTIKEEVAQLEEKIQAEEAQVNTKMVSHIDYYYSCLMVLLLGHPRLKSLARRTLF